MKVQRWFRRRSSVGEIDTRIVATNVGNQPHTYDNMLGLTWRIRNEEGMEQDWDHGRHKNFRCTEAGIVAAKRLASSWIRWTHLGFIGCTTHHENLTIGFLAGKHPKSTYNMPNFDVCKKGCKFIWGQGAECKIALQTCGKWLRWTNHHHHAKPWTKLPQIHIWHGPFWIWAKNCKTEKNKQGV